MRAGWVFGDPEPGKGTWYNRAYRLAEWIRQNRTLLILDGMETLKKNEKNSVINSTVC